MYCLAGPGVGAGQWLSLRLQMIAAVLVSCVAVLAVLDHEWVVPTAASQEDRRLGGAGLVGLSLSYVLPLTGLLNQLLTTSAETEQEMVAVERILEYTRLEPQASPSCFQLKILSTIWMHWMLPF
jgi:ATP-binding cassette, subfamily C (CFTR/MRP), member 10